ncbi:MAG TPA: hypothetical protein VGK23_11295 [Methanomassiliicoccales archaeon]|jgi:hypothetical protein
MFQRIESYFSMTTPEGREHLFRLAQYVSYGMLLLGCIFILYEIVNGGLN